MEQLSHWHKKASANTGVILFEWASSGAFFLFEQQTDGSRRKNRDSDSVLSDKPRSFANSVGLTVATAAISSKMADLKF